MTRRKSGSNGARVVVAIGGLVLGAMGHGQQDVGDGREEAAQRRPALEEVVVTATRRETGLQVTPLAVTAISEQQIQNSFSRDIRGVADMVPNTVIENVTPFYAASIGIRGTGTGDIITTVDSAVSVVIDDFVLPHVHGQLLDPFDVSQIEVLRGPQGTLHGKNTTGGVVILRTKRPRFDGYDAELEAKAGNVGTFEGRGAVNVPLVQDLLAFRGMVSYLNTDGQYQNDKVHSIYATDEQPDTPLGLPVNGDGRDLGGRDVFYTRNKLLLQPSRDYEALLSVDYLRDRSDSKPIINETPADGSDRFGIPRSFLFNAIGFPGIRQTCGDHVSQDCILSTGVSFRDDGLEMDRGHRLTAYSAFLDQNLGFELGELKLFTGYRHQKERLPSSFTGESWPSLFDATRNLERDLVQVETRFTSTFGGPFDLVAGAAYFVNNLDWRSMSYVGFVNVPIDLGGCDIEQPGNTPGSCLVIGPGANERANFSTVAQDGDAVGIYTEVYYDITDAFRLTVGGRYSYEEKKFEKRNAAVLTEAEVTRFAATDGSDTIEDGLAADRFQFVFEDDESWDSFTFKAVLGWEIDEANYTYLSFNQGFKSGSFVETCTSLGTCRPFEQETADSYELGYKGELFDRTLRTNLAVFYTEFQDVVRSQVVRVTDRFGNPSQETQFRNIAGQESWGVESEVNWLVTPELQLNLSASYLDAEYTDFLTDIDGGTGTADRPQCLDVDAAGNDDAVCLGVEPNFAPEWQLGADLSYLMTLGRRGTIEWLGGVHWQPEYEFSVFNSDLTQAEERTLLSATIVYTEPRERYQVALFGRNLLDETYRVAGNSVAGLFNFTNYGATRRYGVELRMSF